MRAVRAFVISFVLALSLFGVLAYNIVTGSFSFKFSTPELSDSTVAEEEKYFPESEKHIESNAPSGADDSEKDEELVLNAGEVTNATFLVVGTDYQPNVLNYNFSGYDENGLYVKNRTVEADTLLLIKIDKAKKTFMFSSIPANAVMNQSTNKTVSQLYSEKGASYMADCVYALTGISVEHLAVISVEDSVKALKKIGNITYNVPYDMYYVDKTQKLEINLKAGLQELTPKQAVSMLRYKNYEEYTGYSRENMAVDFSKAMFEKLTSPAYLGTAVSLFNDVVGYFETTFKLSDFTEHIDLIFSYPDYQTKIVTYPGYEKEIYGKKVFVPNISEAVDSYAEYK